MNLRVNLYKMGLDQESGVTDVLSHKNKLSQFCNSYTVGFIHDKKKGPQFWGFHI